MSRLCSVQISYAIIFARNLICCIHKRWKCCPMKQKSRINGTEYTFLESLPVLGKESLLILCADNCGNRALCPEELWHNGEVCENQVFSINTHSSAQQKIEFFLSLFRDAKMFMQGAISASKQGKAAIHQCAKTNGSTVYVIKRNTGARIAPIGNFCPWPPKQSRPI